MVDIKDNTVFIGLLRPGFHPTLIAVVNDWLKLTPVIMVTSGHRLDDPGVHGTYPCRGLDLRSWIYEYPERMCQLMNDWWGYDAKRPHKQVAKVHDSGKGKHIHLQVHPKTRRRYESI